MTWLIIILITMVLLGLFALFLPLTGELTIQVDQEIHLAITIKLFSISIYSKTNRFSISEFIDQYLKPVPFKKKESKEIWISKIKLKRLRWCSKIGLDETDKTALSVSCLMILKGIVMQVIQIYLNQPQEFSYNVEPDFDQLSFKSDCKCMFSIRLGQAIYIRLKR